MPSKMEGQNKAGISTENGSGGDSNSAPPLNAEEVDVELLPLVHDIIRVLEKDCSDVSQRSRDSLEASQVGLNIFLKTRVFFNWII